MEPELVHYLERCMICRKRKATKLCDFVVGEVWNSIDFKTAPMTCDKGMCDRCAVYLGGDTHFCPKHAREAKERLMRI